MATIYNNSGDNNESNLKTQDEALFIINIPRTKRFESLFNDNTLFLKITLPQMKDFIVILVF